MTRDQERKDAQMPNAKENTELPNNSMNKKRKWRSTSRDSSHPRKSPPRAKTLPPLSPPPPCVVIQEIKKEPLSTENISNEDLFRKIYYKCNKKLNIETLFRIQDLIQQDKLGLDALEREEFVDSMRYFNDKNIDLLDEFLRSKENYDTNGELKLEKITRWAKSLNLLNDMPSLVSIFKAGSLVADEQTVAKATAALSLPKATTPPSYADSTVAAIAATSNTIEKGEVCIKRKLEQLGYAIVFSDANGLLIRSMKNEEPDIDPENCYGIPLKRTRFGRVCFVSDLPHDDEIVIQLLNAFLSFGRVVEIKLKRQPFYNVNTNPRFGFVVLASQESAMAAIKNLNNQNIRPNMPLMVKECVASLKTQLILSNVPSDVDVNRLRKDLSCHFNGIRMIKEENNKFIVDFISYAHASTAKEVIKRKSYSIYPGRRLWAELCYDIWHRTELFVQHRREKMSEDELIKLFGQYGTIVRLKNMSNHSYIEFENGVEAALAYDELYKQQNHDKIRISHLLLSNYYNPGHHRHRRDDKENYYSQRVGDSGSSSSGEKRKRESSKSRNQLETTAQPLSHTTMAENKKQQQQLPLQDLINNAHSSKTNKFNRPMLKESSSDEINSMPKRSRH